MGAVDVLSIFLLFVGFCILVCAMLVIIGFAISMFIAFGECWFHRRDL